MGSVPSFFFFFNDTATTEIYTLSLHDALPISRWRHAPLPEQARCAGPGAWAAAARGALCVFLRSEEHTSELQSRLHLVCRLLLEKKKKRVINPFLYVHRFLASLHFLPSGRHNY